MTETGFTSLLARCCGTTPRDRRNLTRLLGAFLAWTVVFVGATQLIKRDLLPAGWIPWAVAAVPTIVGIYMVVQYARFLREGDELQRAIHLEALALGFAGGWFGASGYRIFERLGAPSVDILDAVMALAVFYSIGLMRATLRYR